MSKYIDFDDSGKMLFREFDCDCGLQHILPTQDIYIGTGLVPRLPDMIRAKSLGTRCVLVADNNTYDVAGRMVADTLQGAGYDVIRCVITREGEMLPDETACGEVLLSILPETEFLLCVGGGSIMDITRINSARTGLPFVSVPTAPSMDGFASVVAPLVLRKVKIQRVAVCPEVVACDLDILATAPLALVSSGAGDILGKYIANADWILGNIINGEVYCRGCAEMVMEAVKLLEGNISEIRQRTHKGIRILTEALLIASLTSLIIGNTRAISSVEHNIAQYWEMKLIQDDKPIPHHGSSVGVATKLLLPIFKRFLDEDLSGLDLEKIEAARLTREQRERRILHTYGEEGGRAIIHEYPDMFISWEEQLRRINAAREHFPEIRAILDALPSGQEMDDILIALDGDRTLEGEGVSPGLLALSLHGTKDYRTRYTLLKLIDECGLLGDYLSDYPYAFPGEGDK